MDNNLNNSMAVDISEITIPMSISDLARRERFKIGYGLIEDTVGLLKNTVDSINWDELGNTEAKAVEGKLQVYISMFESIFNRIENGESDV